MQHPHNTSCHGEPKSVTQTHILVTDTAAGLGPLDVPSQRDQSLFRSVFGFRHRPAVQSHTHTERLEHRPVYRQTQTDQCTDNL
jgi:hypothetical protein